MIKPLSPSICCCFLLSLLLAAPLRAEFSSMTQIEFLYSTGYDHRPKPAEGIMTIKNASTFSLGDSFLFADFQNFGNYHNNGTLYTEWSPRLSLGKTLKGKPMAFGLIEDVYAQVQFIYLNSPGFDNFGRLAGLSFDLDLPGFLFFKLHLMGRDDPNQLERTHQVGSAWNLPFQVAGQDFVFEGFAVFGGRTPNTHPNLITQPALVWKATDSFHMGLEYQYWRNKFGVRDLNERAMQGMIRWQF